MAPGGELHHLLVADDGELARVRGDPRVRGVDALDVREDLAAIRLELGRQGDGRGVRAAAPQGGDLGGVDVAGRRRVLQALEGRGAHALEAGDDDDLAGGELGADPAGIDTRDAGLAVAAIGGDAGLRAGQADRRDAERVQGHRHQRGALVLAGGEEDVQLAGIGLVRDGGGQRQELVRGVAHRGDDDDQLGAVLALADDASGDAPDAFRARNRRAAELHDDEGAGHGGHSTRGAGRPGHRGSVAAGGGMVTAGSPASEPGRPGSGCTAASAAAAPSLQGPASPAAPLRRRPAPPRSAGCTPGEHCSAAAEVCRQMHTT